MYGPTVVITTLARSATAFRDPWSVTSALSSGRSLLRSVRTCSSFCMLRPASAHLVVSGAFCARYSAVSLPVKPVAPNTTTSNSRSATGCHLLGGVEGLSNVRAGLCGYPARDRGGHAFRGVRGLGGEVQERLPLFVRRRLGAHLFGERGDPLLCVHGRRVTLSAGI